MQDVGRGSAHIRLCRRAPPRRLPLNGLPMPIRRVGGAPSAAGECPRVEGLLVSFWTQIQTALPRSWTTVALAYTRKVERDGHVEELPGAQLILLLGFRSKRRDPSACREEDETIPHDLRRRAPAYNHRHLPRRTAPYYQCPSYATISDNEWSADSLPWPRMTIPRTVGTNPPTARSPYKTSMEMAACHHRKSWAAGLIEATPTGGRLVSGSPGSGIREEATADTPR